jgi:hypothetical protein
MIKPNTSGIPGMGAMTDTFDFMKNLWGGMGMSGMSGMKIPGMVMPTLSVEEIDKQIKDLKSVENWLSMNLNLLRGTIQALEVQSATITTIKAVGATLATAMQPSGNADAAPKTDMPAKKSKPIFESPFEPKTEKSDEEQPVASAEDEQLGQPAAKAKESSKPATAADPLIPPMANPAAWWGVLQDQFKQAVDTAAAMTPEMPAAAKPAPKAEQPAKPAKDEKRAPAKKTAATKSSSKRNA